MKTIKQNLYFLNLSISSKKQSLVIKSFRILFLFFISIYPTLFSQDFSNQLNDDSVVVKPDYRNHINVPEYDPSLMPLDRQTSSTGIWKELNPKVPRVDYIGVFFINKDTGWTCGANGALIKTTDGGNSWTNSISNTTTPILKVRSYNGQIVIASGYGGTMLRSTDGGETFVQVASNVTGDLWGLQMINDTLGWACGISNSLTKTTDGGQTWQRILTPGYTTSYWWIDFMNENYGFIAADGKVLRTTDGGNNWEIIQAGDAYPLFCIDVIDSLHIAAAGYGGFNYAAKSIYSSDGGNNWITGDTLTTEAVNCIQYINPDTGYLVMDEHYYGKTTNRGQVWDYIYNPEMGEFEFQFLLNNNLGYSAGTGLRVYKTQNGYENWKPMIISDNFSDVYFTSANKGFVISSFGNSHPCGLYKTEDGGINWEKVINASDGTTLLFLDSLTGFIGSDQIYKTTDGGINWYVPNGGQGGAGKIFFINETTGWAIRSNFIYKTTDRGENWDTQFAAPSSIGFNSIYFVDSLYGWTANFGGRPYKTTNGGNNWIQQTNLDIWSSRDIYITNRDTGWIVDNTSWSALKKTTNGGINWITIPEIINPFEFHFFPDPKHWMISGSPEKYITEDGGITWIDISSDVPSGFNSFNSVSDKLGYAAGGLGLILRYNDTTYIPVELTSFTSSVNENDVILSWQTATEINNQGFQIERRETKNERNDDWYIVGFVSGNGTTTETHSYSFVDKKLASGKYLYRLKQINFDGTFEYSNIIEIEISTPTILSLNQNFPNPFNPSTIINWQSPISGWQTIKLYNTLGEEVDTIVNEYLDAGFHSKLYIVNSTLTSGVYFYKLTIGGNTQVRKMILTK
jgi:photosystem II stability/assembly factor-like uncharacterized protein